MVQSGPAKIPSPAGTPGASAIPKARPAAGLILQPPAADTGVGQALGFLVLCTYLMSGYANEFAMRALGVKAYVSTIVLPILPLALLLSGNLFRGFRDILGRLWMGFIVWLVLAVPFSVWRGGSVLLLRDYVARSWILFFLIAAFAVSLKYCRWLMAVMIAADFLLLIDCVVAAHITDGRLDIPGSIFFANANDLSLQLALAITQFLYLLFQPGLWKRVVAVVGISAALVYSLQTGSRGGALALLVLIGAVLVVGKQKLLVAGIVVVASMAALVIVPSLAFHRISLLSGDEVAAGEIDVAAIGSTTQRLELLRKSLELTITHPIFGVGPGQFPVAVNGDAEKQGKRAPWLGTHNSYTEVSSECGIPAFLIYISVVFVCLVSNLRLYRRSVEHPALRQVAALSFCTYCGTLVFAVSTFFYHVTYTGYLPVLAGMTAALRLATDRSLWGPRQMQRPTGAGPQRFPQPLTKGVA